MSNIVKISDVRIYFGITSEVALKSIFECKKILDDRNISYANLIYTDTDQYSNIFENLSTWTFGFDFSQYTFTDFPIVTWKEYYDDYEICDQVSQSPESLLTSNLILHKDLVV